MTIAAEFNAAFPEPHTILGLRLRPLSLGRYRLLKRFGSPFVEEDEKTFQAADLKNLTRELFFALMVCGLPVAEFKELMDNPKKLAKEAKRFGKCAEKVIKRTKDFSIIPCLESFKIYLQGATKTPWHAVPVGQDNGESVSHWGHAMEVTLRARAGWTAQEVEEEPLQKAMTDFFKLMESEGVVNLISHEAREYMEKTGEANALALAEYLKGKAN
jgi:hypothetical protein